MRILAFIIFAIIATIFLKWAHHLETSSYIYKHGEFVLALVAIGIMSALMAFYTLVQTLPGILLAILSPVSAVFLLILLNPFFVIMSDKTPEEYIVIDQNGKTWNDSRNIIWRYEYDQLLVAKKHDTETCYGHDPAKVNGHYKDVGRLSMIQNVDLESIQKYRAFKERYKNLSTLCKEAMHDFLAEYTRQLVSLQSRDDLANTEKQWQGFSMAKPWFEQWVQKHGIEQIVQFHDFEIAE